ncbi:putative secreted protein (Por secretion system target) [Neolewinella xylanilytica]|uniref:Putative secreted protein (Por secretion system target) n=1 Tax=Neolewinella xylanilytica TaxID=1514080 RepID=A0A2S6I2W2_9BACT|nr:T9SS type A sorting domain-containing protein [Neolewinella xylanilytica]PPK85516.1 putative secreted protein (Por secretion system target) [Neolewinella xylanilytica]
MPIHETVQHISLRFPALVLLQVLCLYSPKAIFGNPRADDNTLSSLITKDVRLWNSRPPELSPTDVLFRRLNTTEFSLSFLDVECGQVGSNLSVVADPTASSGEYVQAPVGAVYPDAPTDNNLNNYIRLTQAKIGARVPFFRVRLVETTEGGIWVRTKGGPWVLFPLTSTTDDWTWVSFVGTGLYLSDQGPEPGYSIDIAFASEDVQLDKLYAEDSYADEWVQKGELPRPLDFPIMGTNCPDFVNQRPVAILPPGEEVYVYDFEFIRGSGYDPDGEVVFFSLSPSGVGEEDDGEPYGDILWEYFGDVGVSLTAYDYFGASHTAFATWRTIERMEGSDRTTYRLEGEYAAVGSYWSVETEIGRSRDSLAVGGSQRSLNSPPADVPANQLRFVVPDVSAEDAGQYYLAGSFRSTVEEGNCIWTRINGGEWHNWNIITLERSFYPGPDFHLEAGTNTIEFAYCSPNLGVDQFILSPDTGAPNILDPEQYKKSGAIINLLPQGGFPEEPEPFRDEFWFEAECADIGDSWDVRNEPTASGGSYAVYPGETNYATPPWHVRANYIRFTIDSVEGGAYYLQARIKAPSGSEDSFWIRSNDGPWYAWKSGITQGDTFSWNAFSGDPIRLSQGRGTIDFAYREGGTQLDKIYLSQTANSVAGTGADAQNCQEGAYDAVSFWIEAECGDYGDLWKLSEAADASAGEYLVYPSGPAATGSDAPDSQSSTIRFKVPVNSKSAELPLYLFARVDAATPNNDSYWVRFNGGEWFAWNSILDGDAGFQWNRFPKVLTGSTNGNNIVEFAYRERGTKLDRIYVSSVDDLPLEKAPVDPACPVVPSTYTTDAACDDFYSGWVTLRDEGRTGRSYRVYRGDRKLEMPTTNIKEQELFYRFDLQETGEYALYLLMNAPGTNSNSVWVQVDNGDWIKMWKERDGSNLYTNGFQWREVSDDGAEVRFSLEAGIHTIAIANREPLTGIMQLHLTTAEEPPTGLFNTRPGCPNVIYTTTDQQALRPAAITSVQELKLGLYPNPVRNELWLELSGGQTGYVQVEVYGPDGRTVRTFTLRKEWDRIRTDLDVSSLSRGVYRIRVVEGGRHINRSFVKL